MQAVVLAGDRAGDLAFEVVMLLATRAHAAGEAVGRAGKGRGDVAAAELDGG